MNLAVPDDAPFRERMRVDETLVHRDVAEAGDLRVLQFAVAPFEAHRARGPRDVTRWLLLDSRLPFHVHDTLTRLEWVSGHIPYQTVWADDPPLLLYETDEQRATQTPVPIRIPPGWYTAPELGAALQQALRGTYTYRVTVAPFLTVQSDGVFDLTVPEAWQRRLGHLTKTQHGYQGSTMDLLPAVVSLRIHMGPTSTEDTQGTRNRIDMLIAPNMVRATSLHLAPGSSRKPGTHLSFPQTTIHHLTCEVEVDGHRVTTHPRVLVFRCY